MARPRLACRRCNSHLRSPHRHQSTQKAFASGSKAQECSLEVSGALLLPGVAAFKVSLKGDSDDRQRALIQHSPCSRVHKQAATWAASASSVEHCEGSRSSARTHAHIQGESLGGRAWCVWSRRAEISAQEQSTQRAFHRPLLSLPKALSLQCWSSEPEDEHCARNYDGAAWHVCVGACEPRTRLCTCL